MKKIGVGNILRLYRYSFFYGHTEFKKHMYKFFHWMIICWWPKIFVNKNAIKGENWGVRGSAFASFLFVTFWSQFESQFVIFPPAKSEQPENEELLSCILELAGDSYRHF